MNPTRLLPLVLMLTACGTSETSVTQSAPATDPSWTGLTRAMDVIHARIELMEHAELLMESIDTIQVEPVGNVEELHLHAEAIAAMLQALPNLFPPTTNIYNPAGPEFPTLALPPIWESFDTFYNLAMSASAAAEEFAGAKGDGPLRAASLKLRASCDACHTLYLRKYVPQKAGPEDYEFDFKGAIGSPD